MIQTLKKYKEFIVFCILLFVLLACMILLDAISRRRLENEYEEKLNKLQELVDMSSIDSEEDGERELCSTAEEFVECYYGVKKDMSAAYRKGQLLEMMTEQALRDNDIEYNNEMGYETTVSNIEIFYNNNNYGENTAYVCIFFDENVKWAGIDALVTPKCWKGFFVFDRESSTWKISEVKGCQVLYTEDDVIWNNIDTDIDSKDFKGKDAGNNED